MKRRRKKHRFVARGAIKIKFYCRVVFVKREEKEFHNRGTRNRLSRSYKKVYLYLESFVCGKYSWSWKEMKLELRGVSNNTLKNSDDPWITWYLNCAESPYFKTSKTSTDKEVSISEANLRNTSSQENFLPIRGERIRIFEDNYSNTFRDNDPLTIQRKRKKLLSGGYCCAWLTPFHLRFINVYREIDQTYTYPCK